MNVAKSLLRRLLCGGLMLLAATAFCRADDTPPKPDSNLDVIQYKTPAGWPATDRPGQAVRSLVAPDSTDAEMAVIVIMLSPAQDPLDLRAKFETAVKELTSNGKVLESSEVTATKTRQGLDAVWQTLVTQGDGDKRLYVRMIGAKVQNRMGGIYFLATSKRMYDLHQDDMGALLKSVSFNLADAGAIPSRQTNNSSSKQKSDTPKAPPTGANPASSSATSSGSMASRSQTSTSTASPSGARPWPATERDTAWTWTPTVTMSNRCPTACTRSMPSASSSTPWAVCRST